MVRCDVWRQKEGERQECIEERKRLRVDDEIGLMCGGVARGHGGGVRGGGTGYKDECRERETGRWIDRQWRNECR